MKKVILMLMLLAPMALFAQKFGHIDTQSIIQSLPEFARANGEIEAVGKQYENELKASQDELQRMAEEYDKNKSTMNETKHIQQQAQQNQQAFQKTQAEKLQPIFDKVRKAIEEVAKAGGYVYIMEKASVLYINEAISKDVTSEVKSQLNKMK